MAIVGIKGLTCLFPDCVQYIITLFSYRMWYQTSYVTVFGNMWKWNMTEYIIIIRSKRRAGA